MPKKAQWLVRLPSVIDALKASKDTVVRAPVIRDLLKIELRAAQRLLQPLCEEKYGGMAERRRVIAALERLAKGEAEAVEAEVQRQTKMREKLDEARADLFLHRIAIPVPPEIAAARKLRKTKMADLPPTIAIERFSLRVTGKTLSSIIEQLRQFCIACENDQDRIVTAIEGEAPVPAPPESTDGFRYTPGAEPVWRVEMEVGI